jgi:hypothetical protein
MRSTVIEAQRYKAHRQMILEDGATASGEGPPAEHLEALERAERPEEIDKIRAAHAKGRGPPEIPGDRGRGSER